MDQEKYIVERWAGPTSPDADELRQIMIDQGYRVFEWTDSPGISYPLHHHDNDQSHWILSGTLELDVEGFGTVRLDAGDRDFMSAKTYHSARVIGDEPVVYLIGEGD
jgi:mannose-6-phosphate isomerase-like protein (cupin superfamily)